MNIRETSCCGVDELANISNFTKSRDVVDYLCRNTSHDDLTPFYLFTGVTKSKYAQRLATFIKTKKLGKVIRTTSKLNRNSSNKLTAYIWELSRPQLARYKKENGIIADDDIDDDGVDRWRE